MKEKEKLKKLIRYADQSNFIEFHYRDDEMELELSRETVQIAIPPAPSYETTLSEISRHMKIPSETVLKENREMEDPELKAIVSPMNGTFYRAPAPGKPPFVETGSIVEVGDTVAIIEAMKLMNKLKSDLRGKIERILVENGAPVSKGQPLFLLRPL